MELLRVQATTVIRKRIRQMKLDDNEYYVSVFIARKRQKDDNLVFLNLDTLSAILEWLPLFDVAEFRLVCKTWKLKAERVIYDRISQVAATVTKYNPSRQILIAAAIEGCPFASRYFYNTERKLEFGRRAAISDNRKIAQTLCNELVQHGHTLALYRMLKNYTPTSESACCWLRRAAKLGHADMMRMLYIYHHQLLTPATIHVARVTYARLKPNCPDVFAAK